VIGDSSVWGTLLKPEETLAGLLNRANLHTTDGRSVRFYNLGYPTLSLMKDLMVLDEAIQYSPDLILWSVTLESFPRDNQLDSPIVVNNPVRVIDLIARYDLDLTPPETIASLWNKTIIGQRRPLADLLRLQFYGVMWSATGIDQSYPSEYRPAARDLKDDELYYDWAPPEIPSNELALDLIDAGMQIAGEVPVILVNEPILISEGQNSDIRYNFYYPRWVYDEYRQVLTDTSQAKGWSYLDLWNVVPQEHFTNSAIHLDAQGESIFVQEIINSGLIP
jgi:hypothetical protein